MSVSEQTRLRRYDEARYALADFERIAAEDTDESNREANLRQIAELQEEIAILAPRYLTCDFGDTHTFWPGDELPGEAWYQHLDLAEIDWKLSGRPFSSIRMYWSTKPGDGGKPFEQVRWDLFRAVDAVVTEDYKPLPRKMLQPVLGHLLNKMQKAALKADGHAVLFRFEILQSIGYQRSGDVVGAWAPDDEGTSA